SVDNEYVSLNRHSPSIRTSPPMAAMQGAIGQPGVIPLFTGQKQVPSGVTELSGTSNDQSPEQLSPPGALSLISAWASTWIVLPSRAALHSRHGHATASWSS